MRSSLATQPSLTDFTELTAISGREVSVSNISWQAKLAERIHVYELNGPSTVILYNWGAHPAGSVYTVAFSVPIEYFAPGHEDKLFECLLEKQQEGRLNRDLTPAFMKDFIRGGREIITSRREEPYLYSYSPEENDSIDKVYRELIKYPEISALLATTSAATWLIAYPGQSIQAIEISQGESIAGFFCAPSKIIGISNDYSMRLERFGVGKATTLGEIVCEETLHSLDDHLSLSDRLLIPDEKLLCDILQWGERIGGTMGAKLKTVANFDDSPVYKHLTGIGTNKEIFAKLGSVLLLHPIPDCDGTPAYVQNVKCFLEELKASFKINWAVE